MPRPSTKPSKSSSPRAQLPSTWPATSAPQKTPPAAPLGAKATTNKSTFAAPRSTAMVQFAESPQCRNGRPHPHTSATPPTASAPAATATSAPHKAPPHKPSAHQHSEEDRQLRAILNALDGTSRATGKLHTELSAGALRNTPPQIAKSLTPSSTPLVRSGLIALNTDQWTNPEGNLITYKKSLPSPMKAALISRPAPTRSPDQRFISKLILTKKIQQLHRSEALQSHPESRTRPNNRRLHPGTKISRSHPPQLA